MKGGEIREPVSWILGVLATTAAIGKLSNLANPLFYLSPYFVGVLLGFILHEAAHRGVARRYGFSAEFIAYTPGLAITFLSSIIPQLVIIAPGYVRILHYGTPTPWSRKALFEATAAGPLTNIVIAAAGIVLSSVFPAYAGYLAGVAYVNAYIAFFNLIPVPPLDGSKIIWYSREAWLAMMAISIVLLYTL